MRFEGNHHRGLGVADAQSLRSVLTMLGISGDSSQSSYCSATARREQGIVNAFTGIGNNVIMIWGGQTSMQAGGERAGKRIKYNTRICRRFATKCRW